MIDEFFVSEPSFSENFEPSQNYADLRILIEKGYK